MPATKKKPSSTKPVQPVKPVDPTPPPIAAVSAPPPGLPIVYDKLEITEYSTTSAKGPLTIEDMKGLLGWETEKEFQARMVQEKGGKPEHYVFGDLGIRLDDGMIIPVHCTNVAGEKVICKFNAHNRPFDQEWCKELIHTILYGQWAGPHTIPGETVNGETIRVSKYGRTLSGQHQMTACILASEWLHKARNADADPPDDPKYPAWRKLGDPFLETIVITGMSEDPRVLMTVDYVKPRTAADVFYTSEVFKQSTPPERKELCKMLATAVDTLWTRTSARGYKTHPEIVGFLDRHKKLLDCVLCLYKENKDKNRKISQMRLNSGVCAALTYIMGSSGPETDGDVYRNEMPPTEKNLDWGHWDKATEFWTQLTSAKDFTPVKTALYRLVDSSPSDEQNQGLGGRGPEKLAILAKAWEIWRDSTGGVTFTEDDLVGPDGALSLHYSDLDDKGNKLPDGQVKLIEIADFYGIDCPEVVKATARAKNEPPEPPPPTKEEIELLAAEAIKRRHAG